MMRRTTAVLATLVCLTVLTGCDADVETLAGQARPDGAAAPQASAVPVTAPTSPSPSPSPSPLKLSSAPPSRPVTVLGPTALGGLRLGMTVKQAQATGLIEKYEPYRGHLGNPCGRSHVKAAGSAEAEVLHSDESGVIFIPAYGRIATPQGIRLGSTFTQVKNAYPDFVESELDETAPGGIAVAWAGREDRHAGIHYRFKFRYDKVVELGIQADRQQCYED